MEDDDDLSFLEDLVAPDQIDNYPPQLASATSVGPTTGETLVWGTTVNIIKTQRDFEDFFANFIEEGASEPLYPHLLQKAIETENGNIDLNCSHIYSYNPRLYKQLVNYPTEVVPLFDLVVKKLLHQRLQSLCARWVSRIIALFV